MYKSKRDSVLDGVLTPSESSSYLTGFAEVIARSS